MDGVYERFRCCDALSGGNPADVTNRAPLGPRRTLQPRLGSARASGSAWRLGFAAAFPTSLGTATWAPYDRIFPTLWMLDLWVGAVLATFVAGWLYRD